jgi:hypothetical protein
LGLFLRSDATYDAVTVWDGAFFRLDAHLDWAWHKDPRYSTAVDYHNA